MVNMPQMHWGANWRHPIPCQFLSYPNMRLLEQNIEDMFLINIASKWIIDHHRLEEININSHNNAIGLYDNFLHNIGYGKKENDLCYISAPCSIVLVFIFISGLMGYFGSSTLEWGCSNCWSSISRPIYPNQTMMIGDLLWNAAH